MGLKVGNRLRSQNSACGVMVIKGTGSNIALLCAGTRSGDRPTMTIDGFMRHARRFRPSTV